MRLYQKQSFWALLSPGELGRTLVRNRTLLWKFALRNVELQHKGSLLGILWTVLSPVLMFAVYAFVFLAVFNSRFGVVATESRADYAIGLFLGLSVIQLFQESISGAPGLIIQHPNFVKKVVFPLEILPASMVAAAAFRSAVAIGLVLLATMAWGPGITATAWWLVPIFFSLVLISVGVAWALSAIGVFLRDIAPLVQFASVLLMFASAVFYSFQSIPPAFSFLRYNPLLVVVESSRACLLWHSAPAAADMIFLLVVSILVCLAGHALFKALKAAFADVL